MAGHAGSTAQPMASNKMGRELFIQTVIRHIMKTDLILSSGFLAFARHVGVLRALEHRQIEVDGICGTSSGALVGSMWASGVDTNVLAERLSAQTPISMMRLHWRPWTGLFEMRSVLAQLREWLPPRFEDLARPFGVGVVDAQGRACVLRSGPLPEAVAASCAIPMVFAPVAIGDATYSDGGVVDRTALHAWREIRGVSRILLHLVERTAGAEQGQDEMLDLVDVIRTRRSGASFWSLGDFAGQVREAEQSALTVLDALT